MDLRAQPGAQNPEEALKNLVDAEIRFHHHVRLGLADSLRSIRSAIDRLGAELPDGEDDPPPLG